MGHEQERIIRELKFRKLGFGWDGPKNQYSNPNMAIPEMQSYILQTLIMRSAAVLLQTSMVS